MIKVCVTGSRTYQYASRVSAVLDHIHECVGISSLAHGGATGADSLADGWAKAAGVDVVEFKALWKKEGLAAGPKRNRRMLDEFQPDLLVAFPGHKGTADCVKAARERGIHIHFVIR